MPDEPKILVLATTACAYPAADYVGQIHGEYPSNAYVLRVPAPVLFNEDFYLDCFRKGIGGIIVMACGHECPYPGAYNRLARRIAVVHDRMKAQDLDFRRLRLCAVCTVCARPFLKEISDMDSLIRPSPGQ